MHHLNLEFGDENDDEDSIKLVPKVLESVSHYSREQEGNTAWVPPPSIMFEVMRSWKMPELYERSKGTTFPQHNCLSRKLC